MRNITVRNRIESPRVRVWAVLADFPNIARWNRGVKNSFATSDATSGVGAQRHCDLAPMGALEETVAEWEEPTRLVVRIDSAAGLPIARGLATFTLDDVDGATDVTIAYDYQPKWGPLGAAMASLMLDRQLQKGFTGFLKDLGAAAAS